MGLIDAKAALASCDETLLSKEAVCAIPAGQTFGDCDAVWKPFYRLSRAGVFEAMFGRAHVSAAGAKRGRTARLWTALAAGSRPRSIPTPTSAVSRSPSP